MKCHTFNVLGHVSFPIKLLDCCDHLHCSSSKTVIPSPSFLLFSLEANNKKEMSHIWESATGRMLYLLTLMSCGDVFRVWKQSNISKSNLVLGWLLRYWLNRKTGILPALSSEAFYRAWTWPTHIQCAFFSKPDSGPILLRRRFAACGHYGADFLLPMYYAVCDETRFSSLFWITLSSLHATESVKPAF